MARVSFYDPYLDVLGGGEKYLLTILEQVATSGSHEVVIMSPTRPDIQRWRRLSVEVDPVRVAWRRANHITASAVSAGKDLFVALTNHFPPLSLARHSALIVQFPFAGTGDGNRLLAPLRRMERGARVRSYDEVLCYSQFVAGAVRERLGITQPLVIAPPVDIPGAQPVRKERKVIAVGRFFPASDANNKKQDVLIEAWRRLQKVPAADGWELHLVGGVHSDRASNDHLGRLRESAQGLAVQFHPNAELEELENLYERAAIFWHAAGYGETRPERLEHFGITTVEAMAHACVPVVVARGGQLEIVNDDRNGRLWREPDELIAITEELMGDERALARLAGEARTSASRFSKQAFLANIQDAVLAPAGI